MDINKRQYLYYMWRQKALVVLLLMLVLWWKTKDGRRSRGRGRKYGSLVHRDVWRKNKLIRLSDTSERSCIQQLRMPLPAFYKRKYVKSPAKKPWKDKVSRSKTSKDDEIVDRIARLADSIVSEKPDVFASADPNALLWKRIVDLTVTANDKIEIASFLAKPEQEHFRGYLRAASDASFQAWVLEFFNRKYGDNGVS